MTTQGWYYGKFKDNRRMSVHFMIHYAEDVMRSRCGIITVRENDMGRVELVEELNDYQTRVSCGNCLRLTNQDNGSSIK